MRQGTKIQRIKYSMLVNNAMLEKETQTTNCM